MGSFILLKNAEAKGANIVVVDYVDHILGKLEESETKRERFVTTDLNLVKAVRELEKKGLAQYRMKMQPAQPLGLICHDDDLNTLSDWAEKMVCQLTGAKQTAWNCKGHDGVLEDGTKIEIKLASWYRGERPATAFENIAGNNVCDLMVGVLCNGSSPLNAEFFVLTSDDIRIMSAKNRVRKRIAFTKDSTKYQQLKKYQCSFSELTNLKHGYDYFLKMKGKTPPVEMPKESIQFVIDVWEPNEYGLMPFDERYEDWSWYWEYATAFLLGGIVTEQRQAYFDVVDRNNHKFQVKVGKVSDIKRLKDKMVTLNRLKSDAKYDVLIGFCWDEYNSLCDAQGVKVLIIPKEVVEQLKHPYRRGDYSDGRVYFYVREDGKYTKRSPLMKLKPFMFTIDHLAELGQIGWNAFYNKYLKEACEETLQKYGKGDH